MNKEDSGEWNVMSNEIKVLSTVSGWKEKEFEHTIVLPLYV
jgi:hypothetical protein